ncbi:hypothetical protein BDY21DRAFT_364591 [Lineolata rhizophorae]|uniref:Uncharacterized protein n=1 Tax=Lineolata rhizophorae TaxID=578093 RepID=A0A6A6NXA9_9PEZI|nr:hypothetical protein BDY21DRAFT_364591 [Lineolata rhizophorae]
MPVRPAISSYLGGRPDVEPSLVGGRLSDTTKSGTPDVVSAHQSDLNINTVSLPKATDTAMDLNASLRSLSLDSVSSAASTSASSDLAVSSPSSPSSSPRLTSAHSPASPSYCATPAASSSSLCLSMRRLSPRSSKHFSAGLPPSCDLEQHVVNGHVTEGVNASASAHKYYHHRRAHSYTGDHHQQRPVSAYPPSQWRRHSHNNHHLHLGHRYNHHRRHQYSPPAPPVSGRVGSSNQDTPALLLPSPLEVDGEINPFDAMSPATPSTDGANDPADEPHRRGNNDADNDNDINDIPLPAPHHDDVFSYDPLRASAWMMPERLWARLPARLRPHVTALQMAAAAVETSLGRLDELAGEVGGATDGQGARADCGSGVSGSGPQTEQQQERRKDAAADDDDDEKAPPPSPPPTATATSSTTAASASSTATANRAQTPVPIRHSLAPHLPASYPPKLALAPHLGIDPLHPLALRLAAELAGLREGWAGGSMQASIDGRQVCAGLVVSGGDIHVLKRTALYGGACVSVWMVFVSRSLVRNL